jgi:hypothetical protein
VIILGHLDSHNISLDISRRIRDRVAEMGALNSVGLIYLNAANPDRAALCFDQMLMIAREIQERRAEANAIFNRSMAMVDMGDLEGAVAWALRSLALFGQINNSQVETVKKYLVSLQQRIRNFDSETADRVGDVGSSQFCGVRP